MSGSAISAALPYANISSGSAILRHLEGANYLFCDGHVKWLKGEDAATDYSSKVYARDASFATSGQNATFRIADGIAY